MSEELPQEIQARLQPGDGNAEGAPPAEWRACGLAEGVIYLGDAVVRSIQDGALSETVVRPGYERQALRYLLSPKETSLAGTPAQARIAEALEWVLLHPGQSGMNEPDSLNFLLRRYPEIGRIAAEMGQPVCWKFLNCGAVRRCNQPEHSMRWKVLPAPGERGVWCVFYV